MDKQLAVMIFLTVFFIAGIFVFGTGGKKSPINKTNSPLPASMTTGSTYSEEEDAETPTDPVHSVNESEKSPN